MTSTLIVALMEEHRTIERLLASLLRIAAKASPGDATTKPLLAKHLELFRDLLDTLHHGREEKILFQAMHEMGMPYERGPLAVMLSEHDEGRSRVALLGEIARSEGAIAAEEVAALRAHVTAYVATLTAHIAKEDGVLYPMALARLDADAILKIDDKEKSFGHPLEGARDRLLLEAEELCSTTMTKDSGQAYHEATAVH